MFQRRIIQMLLFCILLLVFAPVTLFAQNGSGATFDPQAFILSLCASGGLAMLVSGWISAQWTNFTGIPMILQTWVVAIAITFLGSVLHMIPLGPGEAWDWLLKGLGNGIIANLLYKLGVFDSILTALKAKTNHQLTP